ncbi:hypothetical protein GCM10010172_77130 [Paractinoplanes ferrugineus]|uniref:Cholesterol esterase n=1 Tax=Paractinoplanes ferrugineus TaxID=113564 RepID=A0A919J3P7_9ACTN|nr:DUF6230 family protein [Actinoplanes ferrugineus]GIE12787.1 hypothetical protein Afe05nite_46270 [Actinoplanes ferrugineus]
MTKPDDVAAGGVRWRKFAGMLAFTGVAAGGLIALTATGVLAANFSISGMPFVVVADELNGQGFEQFATLDTTREDNPNLADEGGQKVLIVSAINTATLTNLCQSVSLGGAYLKITAGDAGTPVSAKALVVDSDQINGNADFTNIEVGGDAGLFDKVKNPNTGQQVTGPDYVFGQQADAVQIKNLRQNNYATTAAKFTLPHLRMSFSADGC